MSDAADTRADLRRRARAARRAVPPAARAAAAAAIAVQLLQTPRLARARRVAGYVAVGSEIDPAQLLDALARRGARIHLPRLAPPPGRGMSFVAAEPDAPLRTNRHGIPEPARDAPAAAARYLDLVLMPLLAFDAHGQRIGSGAGYYDRAFAYRRTCRAWRGPRLVGVAYALQEIERVPAAAWDVPLDAVLTERGVRWFTPPR